MDDKNQSMGVANPLGLVDHTIAPNGQEMFAHFTARDLEMAAMTCGFIGFDWQQTVDVLPAPSHFFPLVPLLIAANISSNGSLRAGPPPGGGLGPYPPSFDDPPPGGYEYPSPNSYPFYYYVADATSTAPFPSCNAYDNPKTGECINVLSTDGMTLSFHDDPSEACLPGDGKTPPDSETISDRNKDGCGAAGIPNSFIAFTTSLVGITQNQQSSGVCSASAPQYCIASPPLYQWKWETTYNGTSGSIYPLYNSLPPDPGSGTGGITITSVNGVPITAIPLSQLSTTASGLAYSRVSRTFNGTVNVTNTSTSVISGPLQVLFTSLTAGVTLANASGSFFGSPYITFPGVTSLAPGQSATVSVQFSNPSNALINFTPVFYSGSF